MSVKILIVLLLFGVQLYNGQTVSKLEFKNGTEVYEIIELQNNTVEFVNPVKEQPTLREIIFYKVVEKPYIEKNGEQEPIIKEKEKIQKPDFDETVRPFTNGHGLQFIIWGGQDQNPNHIEVEKQIDKVTNSTSNDTKEGHNDNDDTVNDNKDDDTDNIDKDDDVTGNNDKNNDDADNNDKDDVVTDNNDKDSDANDNDDDNDDKSNDKKSSPDNDDNGDDDDDKVLNNEHSNDEGKSKNDEDNKDDVDQDSDSVTGEITVNDKSDSDEKKVEDKVKEDENTKEENEKAREEKIHEEEVNLAVKLRSELFNSTKEKYHTIERNNDNSTHTRRKREVSYQSLPEAPTLPDLDIKGFPMYVQRMLANRPTFTKTPQENVNTRSNYNTDMFNRMDGMFTNNPKTYGFKYNNDGSESWNDIIHKSIDNRNIISPTFKDLSGSETNNPYEKITEPQIEIRSNFLSDDQNIINKNKDEIVEYPKNIVNGEKELYNTLDAKSNNLYSDNGESRNIDSLKISSLGIKDKLIEMLHNIGNKLSEGKPSKTYGMSIKGDTVHTWNDIAGNPSLTNNENTQKENVIKNESENKLNGAKDINVKQNAMNPINDREDSNNNEEVITQFDNMQNKPYKIQENVNIAQNNMNPFNNNNEESVTDSTNESDANESENEPSKVEDDLNLNVDNLNHGEDVKEDSDNYDELDQEPDSSNNVVNNILEKPFVGEETYFDETNEPNEDVESNNEKQYTKRPDYSQNFVKKTDKSPEITKDNSLIGNNDLKLKMEESFDNIINKFPLLKEMKADDSKAVVDFNNLDENNNRNRDRPNTYGMHLEGDHGYMWNELTDSGKLIYVGNLKNNETTEPNINYETTTETTENGVENHTNPPKTTIKFVEEETTITIVTTTEKESNVEEKNKGVTELPKENDLNNKNNCSCNEDKVIENKDDNKSSNNETDTLKASLDDLLKKDEFWQWLSNWTSTYMEVLNDRVATLVKNEVADQIKEMNKNKYNNTNIDDNNKVDDKNKTNNTTDDKVDKESDLNNNNTTENPKIDGNKTNNSTVNNESEKSNTTTLEPEKSNITTDKNSTEPISENNKSNKTNNVDEESKGENKTLPVNIKSDTIYGNAIGNDHVTNIFIFYPSVDSNKTVEKDTKANKTNSDIAVGEKPANVTIDERFGITDEDKENGDENLSKTKDLLNGHNNSEKDKKDVNKTNDYNSESKAPLDKQNETTTEKTETTTHTSDSKDVKTDDKTTKSSDVNKSETTTSSTVGDSKTEKSDTEKGESTSEKPDATTVKSESSTETSSSTTDKSESTEKSESTTEKSDSTTEKSESTTEKSDATTQKTDSTSEKSDATIQKSDTTTEKSDATTEKSESTTEKSDSTADKSDSTTDKSKDTSDVTTSTEKSADS